MLDKTRVDYIPVLDFAKFVNGDLSEKEDLASDLQWIQEKIGFYYLVNHGVDEDLINDNEVPFTYVDDNMIYIYNEPNADTNKLEKGYSSFNAEHMSLQEMEELIWNKK